MLEGIGRMGLPKAGRKRWNGRLAMLGFAISVVVEAIVGHSVFASALGIH